MNEEKNTAPKTKVLGELAVIVAVLLLTALFAAAVGGLLMPRRYDFGSTWGQYLEEEQDSLDVLFFGSSIVYCDVVPAVIWENGGVSSYVMGGPEQTIPVSYYYLRQSCRTQSPAAVFTEVTGVFFERYQSYTALNIGYMPFGIERLKATVFAADPKERLGLLFPPYNYHSRWDELTDEEYEEALSGYDADPLAGYTYLDTATAIEGPEPRGEVYDEENYKLNLAYLEKTAEFCRSRGITPVFFIAPTCWRLSDEHVEMLRRDIADLDGAVFIDFNSDESLPPLDLGTDYYDSLHFNCRGAEKFSAYLGEVITKRLSVVPGDNDSVLWQERADYFHSLTEASDEAATQ